MNELNIECLKCRQQSVQHKSDDEIIEISNTRLSNHFKLLLKKNKLLNNISICIIFLFSINAIFFGNRIQSYVLKLELRV